MWNNEYFGVFTRSPEVKSRMHGNDMHCSQKSFVLSTKSGGKGDWIQLELRLDRRDMIEKKKV